MSSCEWLDFTQKSLKTNLKNTAVLLFSSETYWNPMHFLPNSLPISDWLHYQQGLSMLLCWQQICAFQLLLFWYKLLQFLGGKLESFPQFFRWSLKHCDIFLMNTSIVTRSGRKKSGFFWLLGTCVVLLFINELSCYDGFKWAKMSDTIFCMFFDEYFSQLDVSSNVTKHSNTGDCWRSLKLSDVLDILGISKVMIICQFYPLIIHFIRPVVNSFLW